MASSDMKGYFKQQKRNPTISKEPKPPKHASSVCDLKEDREQVLRQFDMNMAYGPCLGMTRIARWERAKALGLNPPQLIEGLIKTRKVRSQSLRDACV